MRPAFANYPTGGPPYERLVDLSDPAEAARLSGPGLVAFLRIVDAWGVRDDDACMLLGIGRSTFYAWKRDPSAVRLSQDQLTRASLLIGIFKALALLHGERLAREWVGLPNRNPMFGGGTPLAEMLRGGIPAMTRVRALLDARRGGA